MSQAQSGNESGRSVPKWYGKWKPARDVRASQHRPNQSHRPNTAIRHAEQHVQRKSGASSCDSPESGYDRSWGDSIAPYNVKLMRGTTVPETRQKNFRHGSLSLPVYRCNRKRCKENTSKQATNGPTQNFACLYPLDRTIAFPSLIKPVTFCSSQ